MNPSARHRRRVGLWRWILLALLLGAAAWWFTRPAPVPPRGSGESMGAIVYHEYGPPEVLRFEQVEKYLPNDNQVLVKVEAAAANPLDWHYVRGTPYLLRLSAGLRRPTDIRVGVDLAGRVVAVGKDVTRFKVGDAVFGGGDSAFAQYSRASEKRIALIPEGLSFEQAAALPIAAVTALQGLRDQGQLQPGQRVLINGASGGVGTYAVQIAKALGAEVTGVCSTRNVALVRSLGADAVIDYTQEDFTQGSRPYDLIIDNVGNRGMFDIRRVLTPTGRYVLIGGGGPDAGNWVGPMLGPIKGALLGLFVDQEFSMLLADITGEDLALLAEMARTGRLKSVIDRRYPLPETAEAIRYLETGRARGKVIIDVGGATR